MWRVPDIHEANGCRFLAQDDMIVRWLRQDRRRTFEPVTTAWMFRKMAETAGAFVDVGASTGWFSIPMAKAGHKVIAFEPNARARERFAANCELNGVEIALHEAAASRFTGSATFYYNGALPLTSGGSVQAKPKPNALSETVRTIRLDDAISGPVALIKIDVEGHEQAVLDGAMGVVEWNRPYLVLEANTPEHRHGLAVWLEDMGYTFEDADGRNMLCSPLS